MARKGWTERLKEQGKETQAELDKSKKIIARITSTEPETSHFKTTVKIKETTGTPKEQDKVTIRTPKGQDRDSIRTPKGQDKDTKITLLGQDRDSNSIGTPKGQDLALPKQQQKIYEWFIRHGLKGRFNKPLIHKQTGIAYNTIRKSLRKFINIELISVDYDQGSKSFRYEINPDIHVDRGSIGAGQGQYHGVPMVPPFIEEEDNLVILLLDQVSYIYSNLDAIGFEKSQLKQIISAWKLQGIDLKFLPVSLERADFAVEHKTFKADDPLAYIFKSLMRGQFAKPPQFKSRAELAQAEADPEEMKAATAKLKQKLKMKN